MVLLLLACAPSPPPAASDVAPCAAGSVSDPYGVCVPEACAAVPDGDHHVVAGGAGDGSAADPAGDLQAAVDAGGTVVVGPGVWPGLVLDASHDGLRLVGRCAEGVWLAGEPAVRLDGARETGVSIAGVTLGGGAGVEVWGGALSLVDVRVEGAAGVGVLVSGGTAALDLTDVVVTGTEVVDRAGGNGGRVEDGADLVATRVVFDANHDVGLAITGRGTTATLTDVTVSNTAAARDGQDGWGLAVTGGADVTGTGLLLSGNTTVALVAGESGTTLALSDSRVEHTAAGDHDAVGYGAQLGFGGDLALTRVEIVDSVGIGLVMSGGGTVTLEDLSVDGVDGPEGVSLDCVYADGGVYVEGTGLHLSRCGSLGIGLEGAGTEAVFEDVEVQGPRNLAGDFGGALFLEEGAWASVQGLRAETTGAVAVSVSASEATLADVSLSDGRGMLGAFGWGLEVVDGGRVDAVGLTLDGLREAAVVVSGAGAALTVEDLTVRATERSVGMETAVGVVAQEGGRAEILGMVATDNAGPALLTLDGEIVAEDVAVTGSSFAGVALLGGSVQLRRATLAGIVPDPGLGGGVGVFASSSETWDYSPVTLVLGDVTIPAPPLAGLWIEDGVGGSFQLDGVTVSDPVGLTLVNGVRLHGNAIYARATTPWDGVRGLRVTDGHFEGTAGPALLLESGSGDVEAWFEGNAWDVWTQRCTPDLPPGDYVGATTSTLCPARDLLTTDLRYTTFLGDPLAGG